MTLRQASFSTSMIVSLFAATTTGCSGNAEMGHDTGGSAAVGGSTMSIGGSGALGGSTMSNTGGSNPATGGSAVVTGGAPGTGGASATNPLAQSCQDSGGTVTTQQCCTSLTSDFPNSCLVGACACAPASSKPVLVCDCPTNECFDGQSCVPRT